jgi:hypothetical protein
VYEKAVFTLHENPLFKFEHNVGTFVTAISFGSQGQCLISIVNDKIGNIVDPCTLKLPDSAGFILHIARRVSVWLVKQYSACYESFVPSMYRSQLIPLFLQYKRKSGGFILTNISGGVEIFALLLKGLTCVVPNTNDLPELSIVAPDEDVVSA